MTRRALAWSATLVVASLLVAPGRANAYLIDLNDAAVLDHGSMALELQPIGYYQTLIGEEEHQLIAPSFQLYWGLADGWDVLYLARGFGLLDGDPDQGAYSFDSQMIAFRAMVRDGSYCCSDDGEGPSMTVQVGAWLPGIEGDPGVGASAAFLIAQQWPEGTLHGNVWFNLTRELTFELFVSVVYESPADWPVRPTAELWFDLYDNEPLISGLLGAVGDVTDDFSIQAGVRVSGWEDFLDLEIRLSSWIEWEVWDPSGGADEEDEDDEESGAQASRSSSSQSAQRPPDVSRRSRLF